MSKPVKEMIVEDYKQRFEGVEGALVVDIRGVNAAQNHEFRSGLRAKDIRVTIVKNTLAKTAFAGTKLEKIGPALEGPSAIAYGAESVIDVAREVVDWAKKIANLSMKGAILDGEYFDGEAGVRALSKFPTRDEALGQVVQLILSPGSQLVGCVAAPGGQLMACVEAMIEKLEKGETIAKVA